MHEQHFHLLVHLLFHYVVLCVNLIDEVISVILLMKEIVRFDSHLMYALRKAERRGEEKRASSVSIRFENMLDEIVSVQDRFAFVVHLANTLLTSTKKK